MRVVICIHRAIRLKTKLNCYAGCVCAVREVNCNESTIICANIVDVLLCMITKNIFPEISMYTCGCNDCISREDNGECNFATPNTRIAIYTPTAGICK